MAGFTNAAFRAMLRFFGGVGLIATEMVSARAFVYMNDRGDGFPDRLWGISDEERPLSVQIWDNLPETLAETGRRVAQDFGASAVDLNFGCPAPKIVKNSASGSALLANPEKVGNLVALVVRACAPTPVTAKIRLGLTADTINAVDVAQAVEEAGAAAITVHGRTAAQMYRGEADWNEIARIRPRLKRIPLIGNGDITTPEEAFFRLKNEPVDGVMIGRAALEKPWIFRQTAALLRSEPLPPEPTLAEQKTLLLKHFELVLARFGETKGTLLMRKYACDWSRSKPGGKTFRVAVSTVERSGEFRAAVEKFFPTDDFSKKKDADSI